MTAGLIDFFVGHVAYDKNNCRTDSNQCFVSATRSGWGEERPAPTPGTASKYGGF